MVLNMNAKLRALDRGQRSRYADFMGFEEAQDI